MQFPVLLLLLLLALMPALCAILYLHRRRKKLLAVAGLGAFAWLVALIRSVILQPTYLFIGSPQIPPMWFIGFSAILAGIFEEGFRYKFMKSFVEERTWLNGVAFGLGAVLLEILLIYWIPVITTAIMHPDSMNFADIFAGAVERNLVVCIQVGSALLVMHSLRKPWILGVAISFHATVDFVAPTLGFYSSLTIWQVEYIVATFAGIALVIVYLEKIFLTEPIKLKMWEVY